MLLGVSELSSKNSTESAVVVPVSRFDVHPRYLEPRAYHDVAVLHLENKVRIFANKRFCLLDCLSFKVNFTAAISPVCLPESANLDVDKLSGRLATLIGWGVESRGQKDVSNKLQRTVLSLYPQRNA